MNKFIYPLHSLTVGEGEPDLNQVAEFIGKNKENDKVKEFLTKVNHKVGDDEVKKYLTENKEFSNSIFDNRVSKAVETNSTKLKKEYADGLPALIETEYQKRHPEESEETKANRVLEKKVTDLEELNKRADLRSSALEAINVAKLPFTKLVDKFLGEDIDSTISNISAFQEIWEKSVEARAQELAGKKHGREADDHEDNEDSLEKQLVVAEKARKLLEVMKLKNLIANKKAKK